MSDLSYKYIVGIDEAGRGPLAGPVAVGVVALTAEFYQKYLLQEDRIPVGRDSKKLTEKQRERWFAELKKDKKTGLLDYQVALVSSNNIDQLGIVSAIYSGLSGCLAKLKLEPAECLVLLDGGLRAPEIFINQQTIIKGDEKEAIIGLASIVAKVTRDHYMIKLAAEYPQYQFEKHKGYGTKRHFALIKEYGISQIHRRSFLKGFE